MSIPLDLDQYRLWWKEQVPEIPYGFCWCGCGGRPRVAVKANRKSGDIKGEPRRFIRYHNLRGYTQRTLPDPPYVFENRGYETPCWVWIGAKNGYGRGVVGLRGKRRIKLAHVVFYEDKYDTIPEGLELDHLCRVLSCVNPDHLEPVTHIENVHRGLSTKLTQENIDEMRELYTTGSFTQKELAVRFGITPGYASRVLRRKTR